jgi:flagellar assembly protein FliH
MMSSLFSDVLSYIPTEIAAFAYRDIDEHAFQATTLEPHEDVQAGHSGPSTDEIAAMVEHARAEAEADAEQRTRTEYDARSQRNDEQIRHALNQFAHERSSYFARVEAEVIRLSLAIARRILHREAQVDPLIVATLVRVAAEKLEAASSVVVHVCPSECDRWREYLADLTDKMNLTLAPDPTLEPGDCTLETEMGSTDLGIDAQLKEVEKGFFDLLAQRPSIP